jgi:hypothetical protein
MNLMRKRPGYPVGLDPISGVDTKRRIGEYQRMEARGVAPGSLELECCTVAAEQEVAVYAG